MLNVQITFLENVLTITNILSLVLQSDCKDFGAVRCPLSTTLTTLNDMQNMSSFHLKSFCAYQDVLSQIKPFASKTYKKKVKNQSLKFCRRVS